MKNTMKADSKHADDSGDMRPEYRFDYSKGQPNRFAGRVSPERVVIVLDPDVAEVFTDGETVNAALRAILAAVPKAPGQRGE